MVYAFTNRRRSKDAALAIIETNGSGGVSILVREGIVYIGVVRDFSGLSSIMHFGEPCLITIVELMDHGMEEFYRNNGVSRFRV